MGPLPLFLGLRDDFADLGAIARDPEVWWQPIERSDDVFALFRGKAGAGRKQPSIYRECEIVALEAAILTRIRTAMPIDGS